MQMSHVGNCWSKDGVGVIRVDGTGQVVFVGASCATSAVPFTRTHDLTISPLGKENGVVALVIVKESRTGKGATTHWDNYQFLVPFSWDEGKLEIDDEHPFLPMPDRLGQINSAYDLMVSTAGQRFSTCRNEWVDPNHPAYLKKKSDLLEQGVRIIDDPNLLCRFLVGQATLENLESVATMDKRDHKEYLLHIASTGWEEEKSKTAQLTKMAAELEKNRDAWKDKWYEVDEDYQSVSRERKEFKLQAEYSLELLIHISRRLLQALGNLGDEKTGLGKLWWVQLRKIRGIRNELKDEVRKLTTPK